MAFLCHEFVDSLGAATSGLNSTGRMMREEFPELAKEIERTGKKNEPDYSFPMALDFKDRSGKLRIRVQGHVMIAWYNKKKLEIIDRVESSLTKGKRT